MFPKSYYLTFMTFLPPSTDTPSLSRRPRRPVDRVRVRASLPAVCVLRPRLSPSGQDGEVRGRALWLHQAPSAFGSETSHRTAEPMRNWTATVAERRCRRWHRSFGSVGKRWDRAFACGKGGASLLRFGQPLLAKRHNLRILVFAWLFNQ